jgi:type IV pilus assembly protein PilV
MTGASRQGPHREQGITLVESLVALVVLSVGMLGIASLYLTSLKTNRTALIRTHAVNLVNDMGDRIRANARARAAYDLQDAYAGAPALRDCVAVANCSSAELAEDDLARWLEQVRDTLPGGSTAAEVDFTAAAAAGRPDRYRIRVAWRESGELADFDYESNVLFIPVMP